MNRKSFTLIEVLVTVAIFTMMVLAMYMLFGKGTSLNESLGVEADILANGRAAIQQLVIDLQESGSDTLTLVANQSPFFVDPLNGETHQILIFASARGDSAVVPGEDVGRANNNYAHLDATNRPSWRSAVIYCTFVIPGPDGIIPSADDIQQLRRYVDFGGLAVAFYDTPGLFPLAVTSITAAQINLTRGDGTALNIPRNAGRVVANYITSEDANNNGALDGNENDGNNSAPPDNGDGVLDRGVDFNLSAAGSLLGIKLFITKPQTSLTRNIRHLRITLSDSAVMRN